MNQLQEDNKHIILHHEPYIHTMLYALFYHKNVFESFIIEYCIHDGVNQMQANSTYITLHHAPYTNDIFNVLFDN